MKNHVKLSISTSNSRRWFLAIPLILSSLTISLSVNSCSSKPQLIDPPKIKFDDQLRTKFDFYIGTLEGCVVGKKEQPISKLKISADLEEFINITAQPAQTDELGCYKINLFWKNQPYLLADVFPSPAKSSFTVAGLPYLQAARTVNLDIPIVTGNKNEPLIIQEVTTYSVSYILKRIAEEVVIPRILTLSFGVEDYNTGFPVIGANVTLTAPGSIVPVDSLLAAYITQANLRNIAGETIPPFILTSDTQVQAPKGAPQFTVLNYAEYKLTITHPDYHSVAESFYIEDRELNKIVRLTPKDQDRRIDIIDR